MALLCPECRRPLDAASDRCPEGHRPERDGPVLRLVSGGWKREHAAFFAALAASRDARGTPLSPADLRALPAGPAAVGVEWTRRRKDLELVRRLVAGSRRRILDVGAWNGWLSNRLAADGHDVTGLELWSHPVDGLGARRHHETSWRAIEMDVADLTLLDETFDVVIANRCLPFFPDPARWLAAARDRVAPGGLLVATGLPFHRDPSLKRRQVTEARARHRERWGVDLFLRETRGALDGTDLEALRRSGFEVRPHRAFWLENLKAWLRPTLPWIGYALWRRP